jgi:hypothetical protein
MNPPEKEIMNPPAQEIMNPPEQEIMNPPEQEIMNPSEQVIMNQPGQEVVNTSKQEAIYESAGAGINEKIRQKVLKICKSNTFTHLRQSYHKRKPPFLQTPTSHASWKGKPNLLTCHTERRKLREK